MSTNTFWRTPRPIYQVQRYDDALALARRMAEERGESVAVVERPDLWDGARTYTGHDAVAYGHALALGVAPERIRTWMHPHGTPPISDARMTALYAADLAARREREGVAA